MKLHSIKALRKIKSKSRTESMDSRLIRDILQGNTHTATHKRRELQNFKQVRMKSLVSSPMDMKQFSEEAKEALIAVHRAASAVYDTAYLGIVRNQTSYDMGIITNISYSAQKAATPSKTADLVFADEGGNYLNVFFHFSVALGNGCYTTWRVNAVTVLPPAEAFLHMTSQEPWVY